MANYRIEVNYEGVGELLNSPELAAGLEEIAAGIASACGSGYASDTYSAGSRVIASVYTDTEEAMKDNLENNTILCNMGGQT